jgi:transcriptional regulator with XRE-family HTH domain
MPGAKKKLEKRRVRLMKLQDRAQLLFSFGRRLEQLRLANKLTPSQFEIRSGIDAGNLAKYEQGHREPGLFVIVMMARALDVSLKEFFDFDFDGNVKSASGKTLAQKPNGERLPLTQNFENEPIALLRSLMKERNMKSKDLVKILGVTKGMVSGILNNKKGLSIQNIRVLADYFNIDIGLLIDRKS